MGFRDSIFSNVAHVHTIDSHGDGDGIVNHSIASRMPEKALSCFL